MAVIHDLLTETMRPNSLKEIVLLDRVRKSIGNGDNINQNYCFYGTAGTGKTSLAKILAKGHPTLYINLSLNRGIDVLRDDILRFCLSQSLDYEEGKLKYVILDEMNGGTRDFFMALKATTEDDRIYKNTRFIATSNEINNIIGPIFSRFKFIPFNPRTSEEEEELKSKYKKRLTKITNILNINWESEEVFDNFIRLLFPDLRKMVSDIQDLNTRELKVVKMDDIISAVYSYSDIFNLMLKKASPEQNIENYKTIMSNYQNRVNDVILSITNEFPKWLEEYHPKLLKFLPRILITTAEWDYRKGNMIDSVLALLALIFQVQEIVNEQK